MDFPKELKKSIEECILAIFWPREDISIFFKKCGCDKKDLNAIIKHKSLTRAKIIYIMFAYLVANKKDKGFSIFKNMNNTLLTWNDFNSYYFDKINKLDRNKAESALNKLRGLQYLLEK